MTATVAVTPAGALRWEELAGRLQAAADPTRLRLLAVLAGMPGQQACVSDITAAARLPQPMVSHHLQILYRAALVTRARHGSRAYYQLDQHELHALAGDLASPQGLSGPPTVQGPTGPRPE